ncbi:hypothetical protein LOC51_00580 [Rubrivivax sp. JA1024]|nr:hypothetical protein [Rubrivivax sp. JA1024]
MIQIPLSRIPSAEEFAAAAEAYRAALEVHRSGPPGVPQPRCDELVEAVIERVADPNPNVVERGPDRFVVAPYEIVDDRPKEAPQHVPTLQERKALLSMQLHDAAAAALAARLSPARARLLALDAGQAMALPESARTPAQAASIEAWTAYNSAAADINRRATEIEIMIEDLTEASIGGFSLPQF